jgi:transposase-like protein
MWTVPRPHPREFREDVVAVARRRENGVTLARIARISGLASRA